MTSTTIAEEILAEQSGKGPNPGQHDGFLLGDSGYQCRKFLLTPFLNPESPSEIRIPNVRSCIDATFVRIIRFNICKQKRLPLLECAGLHGGILLGDSGDSCYPCRRFPLTPFLNPVSPSDIRRNNALCRTRVLVEQLFGILKRRLQILQQVIRTTPSTSVNTIVACVVLHNSGINQGDIIDNDFINTRNEMPQGDYGNNIREDGHLMRRHLVYTYFL